MQIDFTKIRMIVDEVFLYPGKATIEFDKELDSLVVTDGISILHVMQPSNTGDCSIRLWQNFAFSTDVYYEGSIDYYIDTRINHKNNASMIFEDFLRETHTSIGYEEDRHNTIISSIFTHGLVMVLNELIPSDSVHEYCRKNESDLFRRLRHNFRHSN
jgi:hypothetical protein